MMNAKDLWLTWGMLLVGVLLNVSGASVIKSKMNVLGQINITSFAGFFGYFVSLVKYPPALLAMVAVLLAPVPQAVALSRLDLSVAYPATTALNFLVLIPLGIFFLGESFTPNKLVALALITAGAALLYKK
jgi:multidrug transporter EmrE-like cation transporter